MIVVFVDKRFIDWLLAALNKKQNVQMTQTPLEGNIYWNKSHHFSLVAKSTESCFPNEPDISLLVHRPGLSYHSDSCLCHHRAAFYNASGEWFWMRELFGVQRDFCPVTWSSQLPAWTNSILFIWTFLFYHLGPKWKVPTTHKAAILSSCLI